jgi:2,3-dihydroxyphenylpropionate 1,2-dioxygenase
VENHNSNNSNGSSAYLACVPHVPLTKIQEDWPVDANSGFWRSYQERVKELKEFDPDLVIIFGGNHLDGIHLKLMPQFIVAHAAEAIDDCGGWPGRLNVPLDIAAALTADLVDNDFDVASSHAMEVDHGFSNPLHYFLGELDSKPVLPIHINTISDPRPTLRRCRLLGEAIGRFARKLNKRIAFFGTGGLSHQTNFVFPQYHNAPSEEVRDYLVYGGEKGEITREKWRNDIIVGMDKLSHDIVDGGFRAPWINEEWDRKFLDTLTGGDLAAFDRWTDQEVLDAAGYGGSEVRLWIAAAAAAAACNDEIELLQDFYSGETTFAVGAGVVHSKQTNVAAQAK